MRPHLPGRIEGVTRRRIALAAPFFDPATRLAAVVAVTVLAAVALHWRALLDLLLPAGSLFSVWSLAAALGIATLSVIARRRAAGRRLSLRLLRRAIFPRRLFCSASTRADLGFLLLNTLITGVLIGWALLSLPVVTDWVAAALAQGFGPAPTPRVADAAAAVIQTCVLFVAYEFAYWLDHYLSHEIPFLWEFHRVHHTAETLSPFTVFRVHPVESMKFYNILVVVIAVADAVTCRLLGTAHHEVALNGTNVILLAFIYSTVHLQHSHIWIAFTGLLGRVIASPAHHQIHHSSDPAHFGCNLGSALALFDWLFGTLRMPARGAERLTFGVEPGEAAPHTIVGSLVTPFVRALQTLIPAAPHRIVPPQSTTALPP